MSRHRNVRSMNYEDEYDGYDDVYGHSVEDDYCISPSTAAEFMYDRNLRQHELSSFMEQEKIEEEDEEEQVSNEKPDSPLVSSVPQPKLSDLDNAKLQSCLFKMRDVLGDDIPEHVLADAVMAQSYDYEKALSYVLQQQDAPKPQRAPRARRNRDEDNELDFLTDIIDEISDNKTSNKCALNTKSEDLEAATVNVLALSEAHKAFSQSGLNTKTTKTVDISLADLAKKQSFSPRSGASASNKNDQTISGNKVTDISLAALANKVPVKSLGIHPSPYKMGSPSNFSSLSNPGISLASLAASQTGSPPTSCVKIDEKVINTKPKGPSFLNNSLASLAKQQSTNGEGKNTSLLTLADLTKTNKTAGNKNLSQKHYSASSLHSFSESPENMGLSLITASPKPQLQIVNKTGPKLGVNTPETCKAKDQKQFSFSGSLSDLALQHSRSKQSQKQVLPNDAPTSKYFDGLMGPAASCHQDYHNLGPPCQNSEEMNHTETIHSSYVLGEITNSLMPSCPPSIFGRALCSHNCYQKSPSVMLKGSQRLRFPNFSYSKQVSKTDILLGAVEVLEPFDFSTPSPDDFIKNKQMAAFSRSQESSQNQATAVLNNREPQAEPDKMKAAGEPPVKFTIGDDPSVESDIIPQGGAARLTFSSGQQSKSGFTPEKNADSQSQVENSIVDSVKRDLNMEESSRKDLKIENVNRTGMSPSRATASPSRSMKREQSESSLTPVHKSASKARLQERVDIMKEYEKRKESGKDYINLVVIGHVDAGKSTLMGHVLFQLGFVNKRTMHKYEQESKKVGKASFAFAWVLDETEEERARGVTMDVAQTKFETDTKVVTLLDAPGHKDFIPNMITGAAQADAAILVVNSTRGEFETGFEAGGQTREHAMLIRSLGVSQLVVAVNKMDTVEWSENRYQEVVKKLGHFLKLAGFKEADVSFIPCSGLSGENLTKPPSEPKLASWYKGPTLVNQINLFKPPDRQIEKPFRLCIGDVFKGMGSGFSVSGTIQAGSVQPGDRLLVMPQGEGANVKSITIDEMPAQYAIAGDNAVITLTGIDMINISIGSILCDPSNPINAASRIKARIVVFNIDVPLTKGFPVVFHYQSLSEPAHIRKLISQLHKSTGEVVKRKPRCLTKNMNAVIELEIARPVCVEMYKDFKELGRFMLRYAGSTIAAGLITEIINSKSSKNE